MTPPDLRGAASEILQALLAVERANDDFCTALDEAARLRDQAFHELPAKDPQVTRANADLDAARETLEVARRSAAAVGVADDAPIRKTAGGVASGDQLLEFGQSINRAKEANRAMFASMAEYRRSQQATTKRRLRLVIAAIVVLAILGILGTLVLTELGLERQRSVAAAEAAERWQTLMSNVRVQRFDGVPMVLVPAGCFMMGGTSWSDEQPVHEQCFDAPFWIDQTEVTQAQFSRFGGQAAYSSQFSGANRPVDSITWFEARDSCARRGARLPTEAEWEYAARGPDSLIYPWGNAWDETRAVWNRKAGHGTAEVGSLTDGASWVGALDMAGNVLEWTSSLYTPYPYDAEDGRERDTGASGDVTRVLRGGSWFNFAGLPRAADRGAYPPDGTSDFMGFRCARSS